MLLSTGLAIFLICPLSNAGPYNINNNPSVSFSFRGLGNNAKSSEPNADALKLITQLPAELPQRISGFAYDGEKFWVSIYQGRGLYATFDPLTLSWKASDSDE